MNHRGRIVSIPKTTVWKVVWFTYIIISFIVMNILFNRTAQQLRWGNETNRWDILMSSLQTVKRNQSCAEGPPLNQDVRQGLERLSWILQETKWMGPSKIGIKYCFCMKTSDVRVRGGTFLLTRRYESNLSRSSNWNDIHKGFPLNTVWWYIADVLSDLV